MLDETPTGDADRRPQGCHIVVDGFGLARPLAGVGTYTREIVEALAEARPSARFTLYGPDAGGPSGPSIARRPVPGPRFFGRHLIWPRQVRELRPAAYFGAAGLMPLGRLGVPAVVTAHDTAIYRHPEWFPGGQTASVRLIVPRSMRRADAIVAVSQNTASDVSEQFGVDSRRLHVVPEGVAARYRPLEAAQVQAVRRRFDLPERFILFVSTIEPRKNLETLLAAWSRLEVRPPLVIAGGWGWRYEGIRQRIEAAGGKVRVLGQVEPAELPGLYNAATCLAHPAWYEGFGLTPLEALACGTPVVASSAASLPEVVGDAGLLVDPADVDGWTLALARLLEDASLREELRQRGLSRATEFSWSRAASGTWRVLDSVLDGAA
ncbi:glycosyltransferase family 1 protein [Candidatus Nephthysia bennettiae]|uniref:glycosyltransferase family 4 protein n=1 Tax=Candidatus Nephthysia bennettiae TaxID=3127016 RepID=UPI001A204B7E|nr:glycosyltransferase family 4 protein [Candidatus Dormibacteraeota bacterium]